MTTSEKGADGVGLDVELRRLATQLAMPEPADQTVQAVMARLDGEPVPTAPSWFWRAWAALRAVPTWLQKRWRATSVALAAALVVLLAVTPAGARVREWLGFGAVVVEQQQPVKPDGLTAPQVPQASAVSGAPAAAAMSLEQARQAVTFPIGLPAAFGEPELVTVSADGRLVSMEWANSPSGGVRLDQIDGAISPYFAKKYYQDVDFTVVNGAEALWLAEPHPIVVLNPDGSERTESARQSGPSLVWQHGDITLRLEGVADRSAAVAIAESLPS